MVETILFYGPELFRQKEFSKYYPMNFIFFCSSDRLFASLQVFVTFRKDAVFPNVCLLVCLLRGLHKHYQTGSHDTWQVLGMRQERTHYPLCFGLDPDVGVVSGLSLPGFDI